MLHKVAGRGASTVRRYGFHPLLIGAGVVHRLGDRQRQRRLRRNYVGIVVATANDATLRAPLIELGSHDRLPAGLQEPAARCRSEADAVIAHRVEYLGSGPVELGDEIDWHRDFKSGYTWPRRFYQDLEVTRLDDHSDAKVPWELSRGHQLLTLARAARLYEDERCARELETQLSSWLEHNPPGYGINWVTPMEIAFRAVNWLWAIGTLERWRPVDRELRSQLVRSLQVHGRHIALNLEGSPLLRANHYLADIMGLHVLAHCLPDDRDADQWRRFSRKALEREILTQVHEDGVGFEASLPYHGLSLEMFLICWFVAQAAGRPLSSSYRERLRRMLEVSRSVRHPDGRSPVFGDQDSGRVLPAGFARPATQDNLLDLGAAVLGLPRQRDGSPHEEVAWTLGVQAWRELAQRPVESRSPTPAFPIGGLYVLRADDAHMVVRWGGVGQNGNGGHGHNDLSSYELSHGRALVVDSGSYVYTSDVAARNAFRSAAAHNVLVIDGHDMHPLPAGQPFRMPAHARFCVEEWRNGDDQVALTGWHDGFGRPGEALRCRRRIVLDRSSRVIEVTDEAHGTGHHAVESLIHLSPECDVTSHDPGCVIVRGASRSIRIQFSGAATVSVEPSFVSSQYGTREHAPLVRARTDSELPVTISYRIVPA